MDNNLIIGILVIALIILLIISKRMKKKQPTVETKPAEKKSPAPEPLTQKETAPEPVEQKETEPKPSEDPEEITVPEIVDGKKMAYHYDDVDIIPALNAYSMVKLTTPLTFSEHQGTIYILQGNTLIGNMKENKIADMVRDWQKRGDPIRAYISSFKADNSSAQIAVFFYRDQAAANLKKYAGSKQYKLTGKPDEYAYGYQPGETCTVEEDFDKDGRFNVIFEGDRIGYLPASAISFAEKNNISPEDLKVIIASVEYDDDKDRDIISVYISAE